MSLLPSPIPHPLDYSPWELPGWMYEALDWVVGVEWPEGNECEVWDLADQWYGVAAALAGPRDDALAAVAEVRAGFGGVGAVAEAFDAAWRRLAEGDDAPLSVLLAVSTDLGRLVEECGCDIEGAKIEVWIELGILVVELLGLAVAAALTAGAASPAAAAAITATRITVQQIFKRLLAQLAHKSLKQGLKEAGERAAKQVAEGGMRGLARKAAFGGLEEAAEESGVTLATQAYQNSTGRRHGLDVTDVGMSALGGAAGGAVAPLAGLGRHATGGAARVGEHFAREMTGEVLAEQAAALVTGQGPMSLEDAARAAASGATGSATSQADKALHARLDGRMAVLAGAPLTPPDLPAPPDWGGSGGPGLTSAPAPSPGERAETAYAGSAGSAAGTFALLGSGDVRVAGEASHGGHSGVDLVPSPRQPADDAPALNQAGTGARPSAEAPIASVVDGPRGEPSPVLSAADTVTRPTLGTLGGALATDVAPQAHPGLTTPPYTADGASISARGTEFASGSVAGGTSTGVGGSSAASVAPVTSTARSMPSVASAATASGPVAPPTPHGTSGIVGQPAPTPRHEETPPVPPRFPELEALDPNPRPAPRPEPPRSVEQEPTVPRPRSPEWYAAQWAAEREAFDRRRYRDYFLRQRAWFEDKRRRDRAAEHRSRAAVHYEQARWLIQEAYSLYQAGRKHAADSFIRAGREREREYHRHNDLAEAVLEGRVAPPVVEVDNREDFERINTDDPALVVATVDGGPSALTGDDDPPPIDRSRRYGEWGGLRPPLALHQADLERAMPRDATGRFQRTPDPRRGGWFKLANDGGPSADATRGINCLDCTLSLYETWVHGRPRVSAPRTFDAYARGDISRPLGGEIGGPGRVEDVTGGRFQRIAAAAPAYASATDAWLAINRGFGAVEAQLRAGGHGSYAFLITSYEGGGSHAWVALNQNGSVLYLDPQHGSISDMPLYTHSGLPAAHNVIDIDALILGPDGRPMPVAGAPRGKFSPARETVEPQPQEEDGARKRQPGPDDPSDEELYVNRVHLLEDAGSFTPHGGPAEPRSSLAPAGRPDDDDLRQLRDAAQAYKAPSGVPAQDVLTRSENLDQVFAAGLTPIEFAVAADALVLRRLVPELDEASARDVARSLADLRVQQMLDHNRRPGLRDDPRLGETLVKQLVANPDLARMMLSTPELADSLTARPVTLHHLASHRKAIDVLKSVMEEVAGLDTGERKASQISSAPQPTPLTEEQRRISASVVVRFADAKQPGFDQKRRADSAYLAKYLDELYVAAAVAQRELVALAKDLATLDGRKIGEPGWRAKPKDRQRAEDKIKKYQGDASRLLDLAGAKVEFRTLDGVYQALARLQKHPHVQVVRYDDRFLRPQSSGYRDIQLILRMSNNHLAEFRLHLASLDEVASWEHSLYEVRRDIEALARRDGRALTPRERAIVAGILERERELFWRALLSAM